MHLSPPPPILDPPTRMSPWFLIVIATVAFATLFTAAVQLGEHVPLSPWESSIAMEALRLDAGLPVYERAHATHMYGPLLTVLDAAVFRVFGLNFAAARIITSIFAGALVFGLATAFCRGKSADQWALAVALFAGINFRTNLVFFSMQPDCAATLFALVALYFWITGGRAIWRPIVALILFVAAMLTKQTSAAITLVPIAYVVLFCRPLRVRGIATVLLPMMSILATLACVRFVNPEMFAAMVTVPASIKMHPDCLLTYTIYLAWTFPIFIVAVAMLMVRRNQLVEKERWLIAAMAVVLPVTLWTMCKSGSDYNSLLTAFLVMAASFVAELEAISNWLRSFGGLRKIILTAALTVTMLMSIFAAAGESKWLLFARHGDERYDLAVAVARQLGAGVISPQDPTIAWRANGYFGRSYFCESDAHAVNGEPPDQLPAGLAAEVSSAKSIIIVGSLVPAPALWRAMLASNFRAVRVTALDHSSYIVWTRRGD